MNDNRLPGVIGALGLLAAGVWLIETGNGWWGVAGAIVLSLGVIGCVSAWALRPQPGDGS